MLLKIQNIDIRVLSQNKI